MEIPQIPSWSCHVPVVTRRNFPWHSVNHGPQHQSCSAKLCLTNHGPQHCVCQLWSTTHVWPIMVHNTNHAPRSYVWPITVHNTMSANRGPRRTSDQSWSATHVWPIIEETVERRPNQWVITTLMLFGICLKATLARDGKKTLFERHECLSSQFALMVMMKYYGLTPCTVDGLCKKSNSGMRSNKQDWGGTNKKNRSFFYTHNFRGCRGRYSYTKRSKPTDDRSVGVATYAVETSNMGHTALFTIMSPHWPRTRRHGCCRGQTEWLLSGLESTSASHRRNSAAERVRLQKNKHRANSTRIGEVFDLPNARLFHGRLSATQSSAITLTVFSFSVSCSFCCIAV